MSGPSARVEKPGGAIAPAHKLDVLPAMLRAGREWFSPAVLASVGTPPQPQEFIPAASAAQSMV